jgi:hypothetical protein
MKPRVRQISRKREGEYVMGIQKCFRNLVALGVLMLGATGFAVADRGPGSGQSGSGGSTSEVRLRTRLSGPRINGVRPEGNAEYRADASRGRSDFKVQAEQVNLPANTVLTVALQHDGASLNVGTLTLDAFGFGELDLNSQDGDAVPTVAKGDTVSVANAGTIILVGVF